jgi:prepilin-type N-terminal cleavage/methylation domain-containing protein
MQSRAKAFTLIELLVVVAIIGILAAIGVVAYNGYTSAAKKNAALAQHSTIAKYAAAEFMKCQLGEEYIFGVKKSQSNSSTAKCTVLSVGYGADPGLHIGTALQNKLNNIFDPKGSAGNRRLAFSRATGNVPNCYANDRVGDNGCHFIGWDSALKKLTIYTYYTGTSNPKKTDIYFD